MQWNYYEFPHPARMQKNEKQLSSSFVWSLLDVILWQFIAVITPVMLEFVAVAMQNTIQWEDYSNCKHSDE